MFVALVISTVKLELVGLIQIRLLKGVGLIGKVSTEEDTAQKPKVPIFRVGLCLKLRILLMQIAESTSAESNCNER